jgi:hypothetical protein
VDRRTRNLFVIVLVAVIAATGGATVLLSGSGAGVTDGSSTGPSMDGVIVAVNSEGLDKVRGFSLRTGEGTTVAFTVGALENGAAFPPGHLVEHQATAQPVRVWYRTEGETRIAVRIEDTP